MSTGEGDQPRVYLDAAGNSCDHVGNPYPGVLSPEQLNRLAFLNYLIDRCYPLSGIEGDNAPDQPPITASDWELGSQAAVPTSPPVVRIDPTKLKFKLF